MPSVWTPCRRTGGRPIPTSFPRVEERLPQNPAVVVGPDGIGQYGGVWRRCVTGMFDFDTKLCTESFMKHDPSGNIQPCLAYKWEASPDNRVYTLYLRKGHKWSDGQPFTTEDILWTCNVIVGSATFERPIGCSPRRRSPALRGRRVRLARPGPADCAGGGRGPSVGKQIRAMGTPRLHEAWRP